VRLPPHSADLTVDFTALSFRAPERMRFRYRLEGLDRGWQEAAGRRSVHYTNLAPGPYRFRVMASNDDGLWNEAGAQLAFEMAPGLTQTLWFRTLCVLAGVLALWLVYRWRFARLAAQMQLRMSERLGERTRIARALHDTILQSMQGIILHMHGAREALPQGSPVRARLERVIDEADRAYVEGRDQVTAMRDSAAGDIEGAIAAAGERLLPDHPQTAFRLQVRGQPARLRDEVAEEIAHIAREAIHNAFIHAGAASIDVTLDYGPDLLTLTVRDNGKGIAAAAGAGHWGLVGMRERGARIRADLAVDGAAAPGTRVVVKVAARLAYAHRRRWPWRA
jgi:signal transduction histidine kinase